MTDAALAPAPAAAPIEPSTAAPNPAEVSLPKAESTDQIQRGQPESDQGRKSLDEIIKGASDKAEKQAQEKEAAKPPVKAKEDAPKAEAKPKEPAKEPVKAKEEPVEARERGPDGKFVSDKPKEPAQQQAQTTPQGERQPWHEPPSRFSQDAKANWETAHESVKAETHRMAREFEQGYAKHKEDAEAFSEVREFGELAKQHGISLKQALTQYVGLDRSLKSQDPQQKLSAIKHVFEHAGVDPRQWAAALMNQKPDEVQSEQHQTIAALRNELAQIRQQVGSVAQSFQQQQQSTVMERVQAFAGDHPRFDELSSDISFFLKSDKVDQDLPPQERLSQAYQLAERLNPGPATHTPAPLTPEPFQPAPLNPAGSKSIAGAPANGSDPTIPPRNRSGGKGQHPSIDDALKRAQARLAS